MNALRRSAARLRADDAGITLVELIVGLVIAGMFMGLLSLVFVNGLTSQQQSVARDAATGQANVVRSTLADSLRNATAVRVSGGGTRVDAVVARVSSSLSGWTWECRAWVLHDKSIRYSAGTTARGADASTWAVLAGKTAQRPLDKVTGTIGGVPFALVGSKGVQIGIDVTSGEDPQTVSVSDGMTAQAVASEGAITCWT
jgi:type II secretory pathway pseudopilin PulG